MPILVSPHATIAIVPRQYLYRIAWKIQAIRLSGNVCTYVFKIRLDQATKVND